MTGLALALALVVAMIIYVRGLMQCMSTTPRIVTPTPHDLTHQQARFALKRVKGKGTGVVATRDSPAWTPIGPYPGLVYTADDHARLVDAGVTDYEYAVEFWDSKPGGAITETMILDPRLRGDFVEGMLPSVTPFINEPAKKQRPNAAWVWNFERHRVELWTSRAVRQGEEVTICYGSAYNRSYPTACTAKKMQPQRYATASSSAQPRAWYDAIVTEAGIDRAPGRRA